MTARMLDLLVRVLVALATAALLLMVWHRPARSACAYYGMNPNTTYGLNENPEIIGFHPSRASWMVMATRPYLSSDDWDVGLYASQAAEPACVTDWLASSTLGGSVVDFVIGDYTHDPFANVYARFYRYTGTQYAHAQWRDTAEALVAQGPFARASWTYMDLIQVWNVALTGGVTYTLSFTHDAGIDAKLLVFRNPGEGTYWAGRSAAVLTTSTTTTYTAPATGDYAFVVVNDNAGAGSFSLGVGRCLAPTALVNGTSQWTTDAYHDWSFAPTVSYWGAVGALSTTSDYDLYSYGGTAGGGYPVCLSDVHAASAEVGPVDFVTVDFNHTPLATTYASTILYSGNPGARVMWQQANQVLAIDNTPITAAFSSTAFLRTWDVLLTAGVTYHFVFEPTGANLHLLLFRNAAGGSYFAGRITALFDATGCISFTAPASDYYGVVVVDDDGADGSCRLGVNASPCICPQELANDVPTASGWPNGYYACTPAANYWAVAAVRGTSTSDDWDLTLGMSPTGSAAPVCVGDVMASSSSGGSVVDFVTIDYNETPFQRTYLRSQHYSGPGTSGIVQWVNTNWGLVANGPPMFVSQGASDLVDVYDAYMTATWPYRIEFTPSPGRTLLVFENPDGTYMVPRSSAALVVGTAGVVTYTPSRTGFHAFVVVNDAGSSGTYGLRYGVCRTPTVLASGTPTTPMFGFSDFSFNQADAAWTAIGVRPTSTDWDLEVASGTTGPYPDCLGPLLAISAISSTSTVDFVVGDFHHNTAGTYYAEAYQFTPGTMQAATVEWDAGLNSILPNDNNDAVRSTGADDVLECWDVWLTAGYTYTFDLTHTGGADLHLLVFRNPSGGTYWATRGMAVLDLPVAYGSASYSPPTSDDYAVVVVNDNAVADTYRMGVRACFSITTLESGTAYYASPAMFTSFHQAADYWTAVGVRGSTDWDIGVYLNPSGGMPGQCFSAPLSMSVQAGTMVDFVVGDFNIGANAFGTYYVHPYRVLGTSAGVVQWDDGMDLLAVGAPPVHRAVTYANVLEAWDVGLNAGQAYGLYFAHTGAADLKLLLFRNPGSTYWASRSGRVLETSSHTSYTAPATDFYGLVVVNDNGGTGAYDLAVYAGGVGVEPGALPAATVLRGISPNPAGGAFAVDYALRAPGRVTVELLDLAGRRVGVIEDSSRDAGTWRASWNADGRTPPGLYMVRLRVDGRTVGQSKVVLLQ